MSNVVMQFIKIAINSLQQEKKFAVLHVNHYSMVAARAYVIAFGKYS